MTSLPFHYGVLTTTTQPAEENSYPQGGGSIPRAGGSPADLLHENWDKLETLGYLHQRIITAEASP
jgi:hypothetical protein